MNGWKKLNVIGLAALVSAGAAGCGVQTEGTSDDGGAASQASQTRDVPTFAMTTEVPDNVLIPDEVDTRLGTLEFFDGVPTAETSAKVWDHLDFSRAVEAMILTTPAASLSGFRRGIREFGPLRLRPYDIDDVVEAGGVVGKVRGMNLWTTVILTFDNRRLLVPNRSIWNRTIENRSAEPIRRAEAVARIGYDQDQDRVIDVLMEVLESDDRVLDDPAPSVIISQLADSWAEVKLWPWVKTSDWWPMTVDLPRLIRRRLAAEGIEIPHPRVEILQGDQAGTEKAGNGSAGAGEQ